MPEMNKTEVQKLVNSLPGLIMSEGYDQVIAAFKILAVEKLLSEKKEKQLAIVNDFITKAEAATSGFTNAALKIKLFAGLKAASSINSTRKNEPARYSKLAFIIECGNHIWMKRDPEALTDLLLGLANTNDEKEVKRYLLDVAGPDNKKAIRHEM